MSDRAALGWLADLPESWEVASPKTLFKDRREASQESDVHLTPSQSLGVLPQAEYMAKTGTRVVLNLTGQDSMKHVEPDDFIIHLRSFQGGIEHSSLAGKVSTAYTVLRPRSGRVIPGYFRWVLKSDAFIQELRTTTNQLRDGQSIKYRDFTKVGLPVPPERLQRRIASYLDREAAQIDTLISEQERLLDLLQERRRAVGAIAYEQAAVPGSGVRLKHLLGSSHQGWSPECYPWPADGREVWAVLKAGAANNGTFRPQENKEMPPELDPRPETVVRAGDIVVSRANTRELVGSAAVVEDDYPRLQLSDKLYAFRVRSGVADPHFVAGVLMHPASRLRIELAAGGSSPSMQNISKADLLNLPVQVPSLEEQRLTVIRVREQLSRIDRLTAEAKRTIQLARERRSALITAAVTGQIVIPED